jgi:hypothetical protein
MKGNNDIRRLRDANVTNIDRNGSYGDGALERLWR